MEALERPETAAIDRASGRPIESREPRPTSAWSRIPLVPIAAFVVSRVMILAAAGLATAVKHGLTVGSILTSWDGGWYLRIAQFGYLPHLGGEAGGDRWAFFPGLPAVIHGVVIATGISYQHAGEIVGILFGLTAVLAVWLAVREVFGTSVADRTATLLCFFPGAYALSMVYSEGLLLTAAGLCIYCVSRRVWVPAGIAASVASLSRAVGIVLVPACIVPAAHAMIRERSWRAAAGVLIAPVGIVFWTIYQWRMTGTPIAFVHAEASWGQKFDWFSAPFLALWHLVSSRHAWADPSNVLGGLGTLFVLVTVGLLIWQQQRHRNVPVSWWIYAAGAVVAALSTLIISSEPRFLMVAFPLLAIAVIRVPRRLYGIMIGGAGMLQAAIALVIFVTVATPQTAPFAP